MTIKIIAVCDGLHCSNETEIDEHAEQNIAEHGWYQDPNYSEFQYCPECKNEAKTETESEPYIEV